MKPFLAGLALALLAFSLQSCKQKSPPVQLDEGEITLKNVIEQKNRATAWTQDVTAKRGEEKLTGIAPTPDNVFAFRQGVHALYPELPGFGSLDTSLLNSDALSITRTFCNAIIAKDMAAAAGCMPERNAFSLEVFFYDIRGMTFSKDFVLGRPDVIGNIWQLRARLFSDGQPFDVMLFLNPRGPVHIEQFSYQDAGDD
jgi:hypothetical protein